MDSQQQADASIAQPEKLGAAPGRLPTTFGDYRIVEFLGKTGLGKVYSAVRISQDTPATLTILSESFVQDSTRSIAFKQDVETATALRHPNALQILEAGEVDGTTFVATNPLRGSSLETWIKRLGAFGIGDALHIVLACTHALKQAHKSFVGHRDLKANKILIGPDNIVKLGVFGPASLFSASSATQAAFYSDPRRDVFALGVLLYSMLTGKVHDPARLLEQQKKNPKLKPKPARNINPEVTDEIDAIIQKAVAPSQPGNFYAGYDEFLVDIESLNAAHDSLGFLSSNQVGEESDSTIPSASSDPVESAPSKGSIVAPASVESNGQAAADETLTVESAANSDELAPVSDEVSVTATTSSYMDAYPGPSWTNVSEALPVDDEDPETEEQESDTTEPSSPSADGPDRWQVERRSLWRKPKLAEFTTDEIRHRLRTNQLSPKDRARPVGEDDFVQIYQIPTFDPRLDLLASNYVRSKRRSRKAYWSLSGLVLTAFMCVNAPLWYSSIHDNSTVPGNERGFVSKIYIDEQGREYPYILFVPYNLRKYDSPPAILNFYGGTNVSPDGMSHLSHFGQALWEKKNRFPFLVVFPKRYAEGAWKAGGTNSRTALRILATVASDYNVDRDRIHLTGLSAGGAGVYDVATWIPKYITSVTPVCAGFHFGTLVNPIEDAVAYLSANNVSIWSFYNNGDHSDVVEVNRRANKTLQAITPYSHETRFQLPGHDSWTFAYRTPSLYSWQFAAHKSRQTAISSAIDLLATDGQQHLAVRGSHLIDNTSDGLLTIYSDGPDSGENFLAHTEPLPFSVLSAHFLLRNPCSFGLQIRSLRLDSSAALDISFSHSSVGNGHVRNEEQCILAHMDPVAERSIVVGEWNKLVIVNRDRSVNIELNGSLAASLYRLPEALADAYCAFSPPIGPSTSTEWRSIIIVPAVRNPADT